jgi:hypothetical protein
MIWSIFIKSISEQIRNFWILILTVSMAPFFVFVYFLINEASQPHYRALIVNLDQGFERKEGLINVGSSVLPDFQSYLASRENIPLSIHSAATREIAAKKIETRKADVLLVIPANFSQSILAEIPSAPQIKIVGHGGLAVFDRRWIQPGFSGLDCHFSHPRCGHIPGF